MSISIKFFASLREQLGREDCELEAASVQTVAEAWARATDGAAMPGNTLMALNMEYVEADTPVSDGDEVAFFPPVTGG
ncbi:MAG TPA: molybdopterin converting factor subunit 1 [Gammaproteobacteria bacterium]|nr:molybdopterin converting factor subunit 1 [Gammaproteobacteria bacterium]